jgi:nucleoid DNA-binding protein
MDINKYIGRFLIKNKYCSLPGLGVFDLKKENARVVAASDTIQPPVYKITFSPVGSIDDTFASFMASAENVSISNASNHIREYCKLVKEELAKTGKYDIEHLGRFSMSGNKIVFHQSDDLNLGAEPTPLPPLQEKPKVAETAATKPDYSYPPARRQAPLPLLKIGLGVALVILCIAAIYLGYDYYSNSLSNTTEIQLPPEPQIAETVVTQPDLDTTSVTTDTSTVVNDSLVSTTDIATPPPGNAYQIAILGFTQEAAAIAKSNKLKSYGNNTDVVARDGKFYVVIKASDPLNDTVKLVDSLRRFFNPKGTVFIVK